jgi:hypothetical protein
MTPDTAKASLSPSENGTSRLADASKLLALAVGVFYALGLLIVNLELGRYGVLSLELYRPEYVLAGFLWTFLVLLTVIIAHEASVLTIGKWVFKDNVILSPIGLYLLLSLFLYFLSDTGRIFTLWGLVSVFVMVLTIFSLFSLDSADVKYLLDQFGARRVTARLADWNWHNPNTNLPYFLLQMLVCLAAYSILVFPHLRREFGGGNHPEIELVLSEKTKLPWSTDGLPMSSDGLKIGPVLLLMETDKTVVVASVTDPTVLFGLLPATSDAFVLSKDVIVAYRYISHRAQTRGKSSAGRDSPSARATPVLPDHIR